MFHLKKGGCVRCVEEHRRTQVERLELELGTLACLKDCLGQIFDLENCNDPDPLLADIVLFGLSLSGFPSRL